MSAVHLVVEFVGWTSCAILLAASVDEFFLAPRERIKSYDRRIDAIEDALRSTRQTKRSK